MKPYQHHDPIADKGKAVPKPKRPTTNGRYAIPGTKSVGAWKRDKAGDTCCLGGCRQSKYK